MTKGLSRRNFLITAGQGSAAALLGLSATKTKGAVVPSERITVAVIGCGGMGGLHLTNLAARRDVEVAAVCDVYRPRYEQWAKQIGGRCEGYQDFRRVLDRRDIDAVFVTTPDHWHAPMTILACQAGKDVYVEKPMTSTIAEGRRVVDTARRYGRVVQVGIQQRSMEVFQRADRLIRDGGIGRLTTVHAFVGPNPDSGIEIVEAPPPDLDWDMWLGPARWTPYSKQRFHGFRAFRDYAGGELTNWGVHLIDTALMSMNQDAPVAVQGVGLSPGRAHTDDPEYMDVLYEFDGLTMKWSQNTGHMNHAGKTAGTLFEGTKGRLIVDRQSFVVQPDNLGVPEFQSPGDFYIQLYGHHDDFFDCIRSRRRPRADCEIGHRSTTVCLLGNIAVDLRRRLVWDGEAERFIDDEQANRYLSRPYRHPWQEI